MKKGSAKDRELHVQVRGSGRLAQAIRTSLGRRFAVDTTDRPPDAFDVVVWAEERISIAEALAVNRSCLSRGARALFVVCHGDAAVVGPLVVPGLTPCLRCSLEQEQDGNAGAVTTACPDSLVERVAADVDVALSCASDLDSRADAFLFGQRHHATHGGPRSAPVRARAECPDCAAAVVRPGPFDLAAGVALCFAAAPQPAAIRRGTTRIGVIGGGTAGYFAALALHRHRPDVSVTLVTSSRVPVIGVGEATTPDLVAFLHEGLGLDELELYRHVKPTWKLGIRFLWGPGDRTFHHPFRGEHILDAVTRARDLNFQSLGAQLMANERAPILRNDSGRIVPLLSRVPYAYHLENSGFVRFLDAQARRAGIPVVDFTVKDVIRGQDGRVDRIRAHDGSELSFDFYVDATGFRSMLLGRALEVPWRSYASSLFSDMAIVAEKSNRGHPTPYTLAETMDAGWCWSIPTRGEDHRGYVFSSSFLTPDEAEREMRSADPKLGEARLVRFESGRRHECWQSNVFAVGNAYGFVEPLESTALHMLIYQLGLLISALPAAGERDLSRKRVNERIADHWEALRGFLALHFRFNRRRDTPFWRACRANVELGAGEAMLEAFQAAAPLSARPDRDLIASSLLGAGFFGLLGVDNILLGQGVETTLLAPRGDSEPFDRWMSVGLPAVLERALPHGEALEAYADWLSAGH